METGKILSGTQIAASGLKAERMRMEVIANNIANAQSTRTPDGGVYRRQNVVFATVLDDTKQGRKDGVPGMNGVEIVSIEADKSELPKVYNPGHPDADGEGMVTMPNVTVPIEMVDMMTANRAYEANLRVLSIFREMAERTLSLLRGS